MTHDEEMRVTGHFFCITDFTDLFKSYCLRMSLEMMKKNNR